MRNNLILLSAVLLLSTLLGCASKHYVILPPSVLNQQDEARKLFYEQAQYEQFRHWQDTKDMEELSKFYGIWKR